MIVTHHPVRCAARIITILLFLVKTLPVFAQPESVPIISGYRDFTYSGGNVTSGPTEAKPESKLWYANGKWWAVMWSTSQLRYRIHQLNLQNQTWLDLGIDVDNRGRSSQDVYWSESDSKLYIASSAKPTTVSGPVDARLYRYSYNSVGDIYILDSGFPSVIYNNRSATLVIAKDSNLHLWATWTDVGRVWLNRSTDDGQTWETPFELPGQGNSLRIDPNDPTSTEDISSIIEFEGDRIGVLWGNQIDAKYYFSFHRDNESDRTIWQPRETAFEDPTLQNAADDHLNLATSDDGHIIAAVKHAANLGVQPLIRVLKRDPQTGVWTNGVFGRRVEQHTRAIAVFDSETDSIYVFAGTENAALGNVYYKSAHLSTLDFPTGIGRVFLQGFAGDDRANNPTCTKQAVTSATGMLVLASDDIGPVRYYFHNYLALGGNARPVARNDAARAPVNTPTAINIFANDADDNAIDFSTLRLVVPPSNGSVTFDENTGVATYNGNPGFTGSDSLAYTFVDSDGESAVAATVSIIVGVGQLQLQLELSQNQPNPFNDRTLISFFLSNHADAKLAVYNLKGQLVRTLFSGRITAGLHRAEWDGTDVNGDTVVSGVYVYSLVAGKSIVAKKLALIK
jgi:hypothetical protein